MLRRVQIQIYFDKNDPKAETKVRAHITQKHRCDEAAVRFGEHFYSNKEWELKEQFEYKGKMTDVVSTGDWTCPRCIVNVFAHRMQCFKCGEDKPSSRKGKLDGDAER